MHPIRRLVLTLIGGVLGAALGTEGIQLLAALFGVVAGLAISELLHIREAFENLRSEVQDLRERVERPPARTQTAAKAASIDSLHPGVPAHAEPATQTGSTQRAQAWSSQQDWQQVRSPQVGDSTTDLSLLGRLRDHFSGGNALARMGIVILLFGVGFLLRYVAEHSRVPIEFRLCGVAIGALILFALGWRLRNKRLGYALALQGGAVGILYLTVFAALHLYALLPPITAFALLVAISALTATLAVTQNSLAVALLSVTGGFLAPFLASTGNGDHVMLFSYFTILNGAILGIAWFRSWRLLNVAGFAFTFVLSSVWGVLQYRPEDFASSEPFLIGFFLLYIAIAVLYSTRQAPMLQGYLDGTIIFGTPIAAFTLQAAMLHEQRFTLAYSTLGISMLYGTLAWLLYRRKGDHQRLLVEAFTALCVAFLTLALPLALNGQCSATAWAFEGTALVWVGCRQNRRLPRSFGAALLFVAGCSTALTVNSAPEPPAGVYLAALMVGIASACAARIFHANQDELSDFELPLPSLLFLWGLLCWGVGGLNELWQHFSGVYQLTASLVFAASTAVACGILASRSRMQIALLPAFGLLPTMMFCAIWAAHTGQHPLAHGGWIAWPLAFAGLYFILYQHDQALDAPFTNALHALSLWLMCALVSWETAWAIGHLIDSNRAWAIMAWGAIPAATLVLLPRAVTFIRWPFQAHRSAYVEVTAAGQWAFLALWSLYADAAVSSPSAPLPYLPLLNPLDIIQALVFVVLIKCLHWQRAEERASLFTLNPPVSAAALALVGFAWLNAILLRTLHLWAGIAYNLDSMLNSTLAQSALSLLWASTALATMLLATRTKARTVWLAGAALLAVVVIKLFLVDLSSIGTIERIVSFIGVGLLMLVVGYLSPLPPAAKDPY